MNGSNPCTSFVKRKSVVFVTLMVLGMLCVHGCSGPAKSVDSSSSLSGKPIEAVLVPAKGTDAIDLRILVMRGSVDDPPGKEGLTALTFALLVKGDTKERTYPQILERLYPMAASIDVQVDKEMSVFIGRFHRDHIEAFTELFLTALTQPAFTEADFARLKEDGLNYIEKDIRQLNDEALSREALDVWLYEDHPYGHLTTGTVSGLTNITVEDVRAHYKRIFTRDRITIGLAGAVDASLADRLRAGLSGFPGTSAGIVTFPDPAAIEGLEIKLVEKRCDATAICMGFPVGLTRSHPDYYKLMLAVSIFGEHRQFHGRLFQTLRAKRGLNYGDYAYIEHFIQEGWTRKPLTNIARGRQEFSIWIRPVQHKDRLFALRLALFELGRFVDEGITADELDRTRAYLDGYTGILEEALTRRLGYALDDRFYGLDGFFAEFREAMKSMRVEEVNEAIRRHIQYKDMRVIMVTEGAGALKGEMAANAPCEVVYDTPKPQEVLDEDEAIVGYDPGFDAELITIVPVEALFR